MPQLNEVYQRMQEKKKERREIAKSFQDELKHDTRYQEVVDQLAVLKEEKKSIENRVKAASALDAQKLDTLKLDIAGDREMLSDIALTMYASGEEVAIIDRDNNRYDPVWNVSFKKAGEVAAAEAARIRQAAGELQPEPA
jgi:hypothetical protein